MPDPTVTDADRRAAELALPCQYPAPPDPCPCPYCDARPAVAAAIVRARAEERARIFAAVVSACPGCHRVDSGHDEECTYAADCPEASEQREALILAIRGQP